MMRININILFFGIYFVISVLGMTTLNSCGNRRNDKVGSGRSSIQEINILNDSMVLDTTLIDATRFSTKKMDKRNLVVKEWNTHVGTNTKVLDHVTTYNSEGKKIEEIEYNSEEQKWRERYEYDSIGYKIRELVYNGNNRLVYVKRYKYNEYGKKEMTYTYNSQGKLIAIKYYEYLTQ